MTRKATSRAVNQIRLRHLEALVAIAETGSVTRAAAKLGILQPALSRLVTEAETILGEPVLQRRGRSVALTVAGELAVAAGRRIDSEIAALMRDAGQRHRGALGTVRVGVLAPDAGALTTGAIAAFKAQWPRATVTLIDDSNWSRLAQELRAGQIDLLIGRKPAAAAETDFESVLLAYEPVSAFCNPGNPVLRRSETGLGIDWPDLMGSAWILPPPGVPTRAALDQHIISLGWPPPAAGES